MPVFRASPPQLSPETLKRLGLKTQPFVPPENCETLYRSTALDMLCNSLLQQLAAGDKIHLVKGERGIGKTTFCLRLLCDAPEDMAIIVFAAGRRRTINDMFRALADGVTEPGGSDTQTLATYAAQSVFRLLRTGRQPVLLVDEAHQLRVTTLRMILRFQQAIEKQDAGRLNLVLLGEREIDAKLEELDNTLPDDSRLHSHLLRPLNRNEIADYLAFRLKAAGGGPPPFSAAQLQQLQQKGGGLPGKIDRIACDLLNGGQGGSRLSRPGTLGAAAALAAAALTGIYFAGRSGEPERPQPAPRETKPPGPAVTPPAAAPAPPAPQESTPPADEDFPADGELQAPPETPAPAPEPDEPDEPEIPDDPAIPEEPGADAEPVETEDTASGPADAADGKPQTAPGEVPVTDSAAWLQQWPLDYYTVQLAGARNRERLAAVAEQYASDWPLVVHETDRNGRSWYILLYGAYPDAQTARRAAQELPAELRGDQPWPRLIGTLLAP